MTRRLAVLGLGSIGTRHARNLMEMGHQVIGFDPDPLIRSRFIEQGGQSTASRSQAIAASDAVVIASPNRHHLADLQAALAAEKPVFVEKPLSDKIDGVAETLALADRQGQRVFVGFNLRFHPAVRQAKQWITEGLIGKPLWGRFQVSVYLPNFRPNQDHRQGYVADPASGGVLYDNIHEVDLALHLLGPASLSSASACSTGSIDIPADDLAVLILSHNQGCMSTVQVDLVTQPRIRASSVAGTKGRIEIDLDVRRAVFLPTSGEALTVSFPGSYADDYKCEMEAFLSSTSRADGQACDGWSALASLSIVVDARKHAGLPQP